MERRRILVERLAPFLRHRRYGLQGRNETSLIPAGSALSDGIADVGEVVAFADLDAVVAQDVVGGHDVEVEMGQGPVPQILEAVCLERQGVDERKLDLALLRALVSAGGDALDVVDGLGDAGLELVQGLLVVLEPRRLLAGQARRRPLGLVAGDLHLLGQRIHVRRQARLHECRRIELLRFGELGPLVDKAGQRPQHRHERLGRHCIK